MVGLKEFKARIKDHLKFSKQELTNLIPALIVISFIFYGTNMFINKEIFYQNLKIISFIGVLIITTISLFFRISCQKIIGLSRGYQSEFKLWWTGLIISLFLAIVSLGNLTFILMGTIISITLPNLRLGEFRYGSGHFDSALIALWGIIGNLILAIIFSLLSYISPANYFFSKGVILNIVMAISSLIPLPQLEGLTIFFGRRWLYYFGTILTFLISGLLLTKTRIGLILSILVITILGVIFLLVISDK